MNSFLKQSILPPNIFFMNKILSYNPRLQKSLPKTEGYQFVIIRSAIFVLHLWRLLSTNSPTHVVLGTTILQFYYTYYPFHFLLHYPLCFGLYPYSSQMMLSRAYFSSSFWGGHIMKPALSGHCTPKLLIDSGMCGWFLSESIKANARSFVGENVVFIFYWKCGTII